MSESPWVNSLNQKRPSYSTSRQVQSLSFRDAVLCGPQLSAGGHVTGVENVNVSILDVSDRRETTYRTGGTEQSNHSDPWVDSGCGAELWALIRSLISPHMPDMINLHPDRP